MAVDLKPSLLPYLNLMQEAKHINKNDLEVNLSLTERAINNCCRICKLLDASVNYPPIEGWPISRVAVFLVDSKVENCYLFHSSITQGVWSMIEKDVDHESTRTSEGVAKMKSGNKKKKAPNKGSSPNKIQAANEASFLQIAWLAVKESCGISQDDLRIVEDSTVYSISKEKTAVRFYIMQCTETNGDGNLVPINDVIKSIEGPLVVKESDCWLTTSVVEYFHLLPFADKVLAWLSREGYQVETENTYSKSFHISEPPPNTSPCPQTVKEIPNDEKEQQNNSHQHETAQETDNVSQLKAEPMNTSSQCFETVKVVENCSNSHLEMKHSLTASNRFDSVKLIENLKVENITESHINVEAPPESSEAVNVVENSDFSNRNHSEKEPELLHSSQNEVEKEECTNILVYRRNRYQKKYKTDISKQQNEIYSVTGSSTNMDIDESLITCPLADGRSDMLPCKDDVDNQKQMILAEVKDQTTPTEVEEVIDDVPNSDEHSVQQLTVASKEASLSKIFRQRDMLSQQYRSIADDLALCESYIQTILSASDEENFSVKVDAGIKGCADICARSVTISEDINSCFSERKLPLGVKRKRLSEANLSVYSPCEELDDICNENGWSLPTYNVSPSEGGFQASVTMKGIDFECSCEGDICDNPCKARNTAAVKMMAKIRRMAEEP